LKPGLHFDVPLDVYHADPIEGLSLSASIAHTIVSQSPRHAFLQHPRLGGKRRKVTRGMDFGSVCHAITLGVGKEYAVLPENPKTKKPYEDFKTSAAKAYKKDSEEKGLIAILQKQVDAANALVKAIQPDFERLGIVLSGRSEVVAVWDEPTASGELVRCRCSMDHLILAEGKIYDLKFVHSSHPRACQSHVFSFGGDIQAMAYESAVTKAVPELVGRVQFVFVFIEVDTAIVTPISLDGTMRELGSSRWRRGVNRWAECRAKNYWPGYVEGLTSVSAPHYALSAEMELSEDWKPFAEPDGPSSGNGFRPTGEQTDDYDTGTDERLF